MHPKLGTAYRIHTKRLSFLLLTIFVLLLAACSSSPTSTTAPDDTQTEAMTEAPPTEMMEATEATGAEEPRMERSGVLRVSLKRSSTIACDALKS